MENSGMFGELDKFKEEIFACILTEASDGAIFIPHEYDMNIDALFQLTESKALFCDADKIAEMKPHSSG